MVVPVGDLCPSRACLMAAGQEQAPLLPNVAPQRRVSSRESRGAGQTRLQAGMLDTC